MKNATLICLFTLLIVNLYGQKKDKEAWKSEETIDAQFSAFKTNLSSWDGYYMVKEMPLNEYQNSLKDSTIALKKQLNVSELEKKDLRGKIEVLTDQLNTTKVALEESLESVNTISTLGMTAEKGAFASWVYTIIVLLSLTASIAFILFFRSNVVTQESIKNHNELIDQFDNQKKRALERETKLNRELQTERNKNNR